MTRKRSELGIAAAVLGVAVCVTLGTAVQASPAVVLPRIGSSESAGRAMDRQSVQHWLNALAHAARSLRDGGFAKVSGPVAALATGPTCDPTLLTCTALARRVAPPVGPPTAFVRSHLLDLPPPTL